MLLNIVDNTEEKYFNKISIIKLFSSIDAFLIIQKFHIKIKLS